MVTGAKRIACCAIASLSALVAVALGGEEPSPPAAPGAISRTAADELFKERREEIEEREDRVRWHRDELGLDLRETCRRREKEVRAAESVREKAQRERELAEIHVLEYTEGTYPEELKSVDGIIKLAEEELARAKEHVEEVDRMPTDRPADRRRRVAEHLALRRAEFRLLDAEKSKQVLTKYRREKIVRDLQADAERAEAKEAAAVAALDEARADLDLALRDALGFSPFSPRELTLGCLNEAIKLQARLTGILSEAKRVQQEAQADPASNDEATKRLRELEATGREIRDEAASHLNEAIAVSEHLTERWAELFEAEFRLQEARDRLARDAKLFDLTGEKTSGK